MRSLKERGLQEAPLLAIGDGALGWCAALDEVFPPPAIKDVGIIGL